MSERPLPAVPLADDTLARNYWQKKPAYAGFFFSQTPSTGASIA